MATTTTLKLPPELKQKIAHLAEAKGKTPHAFMVEALQAQAEWAERREAFIESARLAEAEVDEFGLVYDADSTLSYLQDRLEGRPATRPAPTKLRR